MDLLEKIKNQAIKLQKTIVLPEAYEPRTLKASSIILGEKIANIILVGEKHKILSIAKSDNLDLSQAQILEPSNYQNKENYIEELYELRKNKGMTLSKATELMENPLYIAAMMVKLGHGDGYVAGAENTTGDVLRPALQIIKTIEGVSVVSGAMIMLLPVKEFGEDNVIVVADCGVNPNPNASQLAEIAISSAETAKQLIGMEPKVAMLSFSTKGSASHEMVDKVVEATNLSIEKNPTLQIDGELQFDAAVIPDVAKKKAPGSVVAGKANVFVMPDLQSGNISVKIIERWVGAKAIGPIFQGMAKPVNDLSRGCSVEDIVNVVAITSLQS